MVFKLWLQTTGSKREIRFWIMTESLTTCSTHSHWATLSLGNSKFCKARIFILTHQQFDQKKSFLKLNQKVGKYWLENAGLTAVLGRWRPRTQLVQVYNFPQTAATEAAGQTQNKHFFIAFLPLSLLFETPGDWQKKEVQTKYVNFFNILKVVQIAPDWVKSIDAKSGKGPMQGIKSLILGLPNHFFQTHRWQMTLGRCKKTVFFGRCPKLWVGEGPKSQTF